MLFDWAWFFGEIEHVARKGGGHSKIDDEALGAFVRAARDKAKVTQEEAAQAMGVKLNSYQRYESGERTATWHKIINLCKAIGTTPNLLLGFRDDSRSNVSLRDPVVRQRFARIVANAAAVTRKRGNLNTRLFGDDGLSPDPNNPYWQAMTAVIIEALEEENDESDLILTYLRSVDRGLGQL